MAATDSFIGNVGITVPLPAGSSALGSVGVTSLPPIPAGASLIGSVTSLPTNSALTDVSGNITTASVSQQVVAANASRKYLFIQNNSAGALGINFTGAATLGQGSIQLAAGASFVMESGFVSTEAVNIIGATAGQVYTAKVA